MSDADNPTTPDWLPDPYGRHELRYWDGQQWSSAVSTDGVMAVDPPAPAPPAGVEPKSSVITSPIQVRAVDDISPASPRTPLLVAGLAVLALLGAGVAFAVTRDNGPNAETTTTASLATTTSSSTTPSTSSTSTSTSTSTTTTAPASGRALCAGSGYQSLGGAPVQSDFVNDTAEPIDIYWIDFSGTAKLYYQALAPGATWHELTYTHQYWRATTSAGTCLDVILIDSTPASVTIRIQ